MAIKEFVRKWTYKTYFGGERSIYTGVFDSTLAVEARIDAMEGHDNWCQTTLKRGGKKKLRKAAL